jgi:hypothetical protein
MEMCEKLIFGFVKIEGPQLCDFGSYGVADRPFALVWQQGITPSWK